MPRKEQIVSQYTFPHEETYINDNTSGDYDELVDNSVKYPYLSVFASAKGIDGKLVKITSTQKYYTVFGKTNYKKYGQPQLMPEAILSQTGTEVWCMRVMPEDSLYANSVLSAWYKPDVENKAFRLKFTAKSVTSESTVQGDYHSMTEILHDRDALVEYGNLLDGAGVDGVYTDSEGFIQVPLAVFSAPGHGSYGQNLRWRISPSEEYENEYGIKVYSFQIIDTTDSAIIAATHVASIVSSSATDETVFINDLIEDADAESLGAYIKFNEENVMKIYDAYVAFCNEVLEKNPADVVKIPEYDHFDLFFGKAVKVQKIRVTPNEPYLTYEKELTDDIDVDADDYVAADYTKTPIINVNDVAGISLNGGSDGKFASGTEEEIQAAYDECYIKAFNGEYDKLILAPRRIKSLALFDANYSMPVKMALATLAMYRSDAICYLDTNLVETLGNVDIQTMEADFAQLDDLVSSFDNFDEAWCVSINTHFNYIKEVCTGKRIPVTITWYLAATDATHRQTYGGTYPRIGKTATLSGHIKNSLKPCVAENEKELKQALYDARINYFEDEGDNIFTRGTQSMYVSSNSDLLEETNVNALFDLKRNLESDCRENRYMITTPTKRKEFRQYLLEKYSYMVGDSFNSMDLKYTSNQYESQRNIVHLYAEVTFPRRSKTTFIEIDINRPAYDADITEDE